MRDEALNANTWDNNRAGRPKGPFNQLIAGGTFGGPIVRSKTFFFGDYQSSRTERALSQTATVPTALMRTGNLSELTGNMVASNPFVPAGCVDAVNKIINRSCFDPVATKLMNLFPMPNVPGAGFFNNNFISNGILNNTVDQFDVRVDHSLSAGRDHLFAPLQLPEHRSQRAAAARTIRSRRATSPATSSIAARARSAAGRACSARTCSTRCASRTTRSARTCYHPAFGIDSNTEYGIKGVPKDDRFYGGLPHMPIRASRASADRSSARSSRTRRCCSLPRT